MRELPFRALVVWAAVVVLGLLASVVALFGAVVDPIRWPTTALFLVVGFVAQGFRVQFSYRRTRNAHIGTIASAFYVASLLLLPPAQAIAINFISYSLAWLRHRRAWYKELFNLSQYSLTIGVAGWVWHTWGSGSGVLLDPRDAFWLVVTLGLYFLINTGLISLMVATADGLSPRYVWLVSYRRTLPAYFGMLFAGVLIANLWSNAAWSVVLAVVPLIAIYHAFKRTIDLEQQTLSALFDLADVLDERDYYTHQHSVRVGEQAEKLALRLGRSAEDAYLVYLCGRLHDIGKCAINNEVLLKTGPLNVEEREHMCRHASVGSQMLSHFNLFRVGASYVRGHHEWYNGLGYPDGLKGEAIPFGARVIAVADAYDAMTSNRSYRRALPKQEALRRLLEGRGTQWDAQMVDAYVAMLADQPARAAPLAQLAPAPAGAARGAAGEASSAAS